MLTKEKVREPETLTRYEPPAFFVNPIATMRRMSEEMDRLFGDLWTRSGFVPPREAAFTPWTPNIEVFQKENELVVRADLPGLTRDDVTVELTNESVIFRGERKHETEEKGKDFYRSELSYGSFYRMIPLPEGAQTDGAKATFLNGVLQVTMPVTPAPDVKARRLEIEAEKK